MPRRLERCSLPSCHRLKYCSLCVRWTSGKRSRRLHGRERRQGRKTSRCSWHRRQGSSPHLQQSLSQSKLPPSITGTVHLHMDVLSTLCSCPAVAWQARQCYVGCVRRPFLQLAEDPWTDHTDVSTTAYVAVEQAGASQRGREEVWSGGQQAAWRLSPPPRAIASRRWSPPTFCIFW